MYTVLIYDAGNLCNKKIHTNINKYVLSLGLNKANKNLNTYM